MLNDAGGREKLLAFGVRNVPVVACGDQFVFGQNLEDVAEFVGLKGTGHTPLPPEQLIEKWDIVLRAVQRYIRQVPTAKLEERVIDNRDRSIRLMGHHVFRIAEAFLETMVDGEPVVRLLIDGSWIAVPRSYVISELATDGRAHFCGELYVSDSKPTEVKPEPMCVILPPRNS